MTMQYGLVGNPDGSQNVTVFADGEMYLAHSSHPNWDAIVAGLLDNDESVLPLFEVGKAVADKFNGVRESLSERVTYKDGVLYFDHDPVHEALADQAVAFLVEGQPDWEPLIRFYENVQQNPNEHSKDQLYTWITGIEQADDRKLTINEGGWIVGYKSVQSIGDDLYESINSGRAIVNGVEQTGRIKQQIGDVVEMPRSEVTHAPDVHCHDGLHVGTWDYASSFSGDTVLEVWVNPRDVVSVPNDANAAKMRVCRYEVVDTLDAPYSSSYVARSNQYKAVSGEWGEADEDWCEDCGYDDCVCDTYDPFADGAPIILPGDKFRSKDARRRYHNVFTVSAVGNGYVEGKWSDSNTTREIREDRLNSYRYERV